MLGRCKDTALLPTRRPNISLERRREPDSESRRHHQLVPYRVQHWYIILPDSPVHAGVTVSQEQRLEQYYYNRKLKSTLF